VAEQDRTETRDLERHRMRQRAQHVDQVGTPGQLGSRPRGDRVGNVGLPTCGECHEFPVGVASDEDDPVPEPEQPVHDGHGLRPGGQIAGDHDPLGGLHGRFGEGRVKGRKHAVRVGQHGNRADHLLSVPGAAADRQGCSPPAIAQWAISVARDSRTTVTRI
jgi:hypothetical protein